MLLLAAPPAGQRMIGYPQLLCRPSGSDFMGQTYRFSFELIIVSLHSQNTSLRIFYIPLGCFATALFLTTPERINTLRACLRDMRMEVRLISLVRGCGESMGGFDAEMCELAIADSLGRMEQWADDSARMVEWLFE